MMKKNGIITFLLLLAFTIFGCKGSEKTVKNTDHPSQPERTPGHKNKDTELSQTQKLLMNNRSQLRDTYAEQKQEIPTFLTNTAQNNYANNAVVRGYRIQLISTRDRQSAESTAEDFRQRSDSTWADQVIKTYLVFKQPFYKVRVGDFQREDLANRFVKTVKANYPGAWVVHDDINVHPSQPDSLQVDHQ